MTLLNLQLALILHPTEFRRRVDCALALLLVVLLLLGLLEVGRLVQVTQIMENAAREGARQASSGQKTYDDVTTTVTNYLNNVAVGAGLLDLSTTSGRLQLQGGTSFAPGSTYTTGPSAHGPLLTLNAIRG